MEICCFVVAGTSAYSSPSRADIAPVSAVVPPKQAATRYDKVTLPCLPRFELQHENSFQKRSIYLDRPISFDDFSVLAVIDGISSFLSSTCSFGGRNLFECLV